MSAARHLRPLPQLDFDTGEVASGSIDPDADGALDYAELQELVDTLNRKLNGAWSRIRKLENERDRLRGLEPDAEDIMAVCEYHRKLLVPGGSVVIGSKNWEAVRARLRDKDAKTGKPCFDALKLRAGVLGIRLDAWNMDPRHPHRRHLDIAFSSPEKVTSCIQRAIGFKRRNGVSALALVDELHSEALVWLSERCSCEHLWISHLRGGPTHDGRQPCSESGCQCENFDYFQAKLDRWLREAKERAETDPKMRAELEHAEWLEEKREGAA